MKRRGRIRLAGSGLTLGAAVWVAGCFDGQPVTEPEEKDLVGIVSNPVAGVCGRWESGRVRARSRPDQRGVRLPTARQHPQRRNRGDSQRPHRGHREDGHGGRRVRPHPGGKHTCAVTRDAIVYCWGDNSLGQLGNGTTNGSIVPVKVSGQP